MKINTFTGGLNTRLEPQFLNLDQAAEFTNCDGSSGALKSVKSSKSTSLTNKKYSYFFEREDVWLSSENYRSYAEIDGWLYFTDGVKPQKYRNGIQSDLGIEPPETRPVLDDADTAIGGVANAVFTYTNGGNLPLGLLFYRLVNVNATYNSAPLDIQVNTQTSTSTIITLATDTAYNAAAALWRKKKSEYINSLIGTVISSPFTGNNTIDAIEANTLADKEYKSSFAEYVAAYNLITTYSNVGFYGDRALIRQTYQSTYNAIAGSRTVTISGVDSAVYGSGGVDVYRQYQGVWRLVGNLASSAATLADSVYDISANAEQDVEKYSPINGYMQYVYTYYDATNGVESGPSPLANTFFIQGAAEITGLTPSTNPNVTHKRLYRVGNSIATFSLVASIPNDVISYLDTTWDDDIPAITLRTDIYKAPLDSLKYVTEAYGMLFAASGSKLYFTPIGTPNSWPATYYLEIGETITGLIAVANGILVFTNFNTTIIYGTSPTTLSKQPLSLDQGCVSATSIRGMGGFALWVSTDGICASNGSTVTVVSRPALGKVSMSPVDSIVYDEVYYVVDYEGNALVYDYRYTPIFRRLNIGVTSFAVAKDILYGYNSGAWYELFEGDGLASMTWKSPRFVEGLMTEEKTYKKVYFFLEGDIIVEIMIDDAQVVRQVFSGRFHDYITVPAEAQRGHYIQFKITGTGVVHEIEYQIGGSRNHGG